MSRRCTRLQVARPRTAAAVVLASLPTAPQLTVVHPAAYIQENEDYGTSAFRKFGTLLPYVAARKEDLETLNYLVTSGVNVIGARKDGLTALLLASEDNNPQTVGAKTHFF